MITRYTWSAPRIEHIRYVHPCANATFDSTPANGYVLTSMKFRKNGWTFVIMNLKQYGHVAVHYVGKDERPNIGFARWYFFAVTGRHIELRQSKMQIDENKCISSKRHLLPRL